MRIGASYNQKVHHTDDGMHLMRIGASCNQKVHHTDDEMHFGVSELSKNRVYLSSTNQIVLRSSSFKVNCGM